MELPDLLLMFVKFLAVRIIIATFALKSAQEVPILKKAHFFYFPSAFFIL